MLARRLLAIVLVAIAPFAARAAAAAELIMFESAGCPYCARWHRAIGPIYPKTDEAKRAPLRRVDIAAPRPPDLASIGSIVYTPTFVLVHEGREIGRIVGYGGEEAFWSLLSELVGRLDKIERGPRPLSDERPPASDTATSIDQTMSGKNRSKSP
ncbi:MAG: thioredoxin family protein [Alphaproteobacteria bacterium]